MNDREILIVQNMYLNKIAQSTQFEKFLKHRKQANKNAFPAAEKANATKG